jgi:hypothetical protein
VIYHIRTSAHLLIACREKITFARYTSKENIHATWSATYAAADGLRGEKRELLYPTRTIIKCLHRQTLDKQGGQRWRQLMYFLQSANKHAMNVPTAPHQGELLRNASSKTTFSYVSSKGNMQQTTLLASLNKVCYTMQLDKLLNSYA